MYYNLSKAEKKIARTCIDKGLHIAYTKALDESGRVIQDWHSEKLNTRDAYMALFEIIDKHDDAIANRFNNLGGSKWLMTVAKLFAEKIITEEDIKDFSEETKQIIYSFAK